MKNKIQDFNPRPRLCSQDQSQDFGIQAKAKTYIRGRSRPWTSCNIYILTRDVNVLSHVRETVRELISIFNIKL